MAGPTHEDLAKEIEETYLNLKKEKLKALEMFEKYRGERPCEFIRWYKWQRNFLEKLTSYNIFVGPLPNKIGKSMIVSNIAISWGLGYEPWTMSKEEKPGYIKIKGNWYKPSTLGKDPPVRIRVTGNDWRSHINETIVPEFLKWLPKDSYETRSDNGMVCKILFDTGSTIEFLSYEEKLSAFESWRGDAWIADEPPKKDIWDAMAGRGLVLDNGKILLFTTLLTQPWILDELIEPEIPRRDVYVLDGLSFLDNDDLKENDTKLLSECGLSDYQINKYFEMILDFEDKSKTDHIKGIGEYLKKCIVNLN